MMHVGSLVVASALLALSLAPHPASEIFRAAGSARNNFG